MDESPEEKIRRELGPNEQLIWSGQPRQGIRFHACDIVGIPFMALWTGMTAFILVKALRSEEPWFGSLFASLFVLIGLYLLVGRFWVDARRRARIFYSVTSERVVILYTADKQVKSLSIQTISDMWLTERSDGSGTITFGPMQAYYWWFVGSSWPGYAIQNLPLFDLSGDARRVFEIVREAQRAERERR